MLTTMAGPSGTHRAGAVVDLPHTVAKSLIEAKYAKRYVEPGDAPEPELAAMAAPEAATSRVGRPREVSG